MTGSTVGSRRRRILTAALAGVFLSGGLAVTVQTSAFAVGGNCSSYKFKSVKTLRPDEYGVAARAASLESDSKCRGHLPVTGRPDQTTAWFTTIDKEYRSGTAVPPVGESFVEIKHI